MCHRLLSALRLSSMLVAAALCVVPSQASANPNDWLLAPYDPTCDRMSTQVAPAEAWINEAHPGYFNRAIERHIHQIWFGEPERMDAALVATWQAHAKAFGYSHTLWNESHLQLLQTLMPKGHFELLQELIDKHFYQGASDVLRVFLLAFYGGIYSDVDISAPVWQGHLIDLAQVVPLQNFVIMSEHDGRNVGNHLSLFFANGLMMASSGHPLIRHLQETVLENVRVFKERSPLLPFDAMYSTGPYFVTKSLSGPVTVLPITYLEKLGMVH